MKRLTAWAFPEVPAERLAAVRLATGGFVLTQLWKFYDNFANIARTPVSQWSPVGPLKLSYGTPIRKRPEDRIQRLQFQIGTAF